MAAQCYRRVGEKGIGQSTDTFLGIIPIDVVYISVRVGKQNFGIGCKGSGKPSLVHTTIHLFGMPRFKFKVSPQAGNILRIIDDWQRFLLIGIPEVGSISLDFGVH